MCKIDNINLMIREMESILIGRNKEVTNILKGVIAGGHVLINDVPGVGKTTLIKSLAKMMGLSCNRIQFTPDLLPTDILGVSIFNQKTMEFEFKKGPIFSNVILADEINRASPKTQSALLQCMEEGIVSEGVNTYSLQEPFIVLATQNPIEHEGTFPLPEAQRDRFIISSDIGYPSNDDEIRILKTYKNDTPINNIKVLLTKEELKEIQSEVKNVEINDKVLKYIIYIIDATRGNRYLKLGASVRASIALMRIAQVTAFMNGRNYVIPDDVKDNVYLVLNHRLVLNSRAYNEKMTVYDIVNSILRATQVPKVNNHD